MGDIIDSAEHNFPVGEGTIEIVEVTPNFKSVPIPKGTVAYAVETKAGVKFEGFNRLAGVLTMKRYHESIGDIFTYDENKMDISVPLSFKSPFTKGTGCKNC